jgi:hypothetical protein
MPHQEKRLIMQSGSESDKISKYSGGINCMFSDILLVQLNRERYAGIRQPTIWIKVFKAAISGRLSA